MINTRRKANYRLAVSTLNARYHFPGKYFWLVVITLFLNHHCPRYYYQYDDTVKQVQKRTFSKTNFRLNEHWLFAKT